MWVDVPESHISDPSTSTLATNILVMATIKDCSTCSCTALNHGSFGIAVEPPRTPNSCVTTVVSGADLCRPTIRGRTVAQMNRINHRSRIAADSWLLGIFNCPVVAKLFAPVEIIHRPGSQDGFSISPTRPCQALFVALPGKTWLKI